MKLVKNKFIGVVIINGEAAHQIGIYAENELDLLSEAKRRLAGQHLAGIIADALVNSDKVDFDLLPRCTGTTPENPCHLMLDDATHDCRVCRQYEAQGTVEIKSGSEEPDTPTDTPTDTSTAVTVADAIRDKLAGLGCTVHVDGGSGDLIVTDKSEAVDDD